MIFDFYTGMPHTHTDSMHDKHEWVGINFPFSPSPKKSREYSMLLHLKSNGEKVNLLHCYSEVYTLSCHKSIVGRGWEKTVEIAYT